MLKQKKFSVITNGRSIVNITRDIEKEIKEAGIQNGLCHVFIQHTSASLIITENADQNVLRDLEFYIQKLVMDGDPNYIHDDEGPDDMAAHIRSVLTQTEITIPVRFGHCGLGTWQGIFVWEHRTQPHQRQITLTIYGE
jgi:secondary thiamine-phosphate synthase enzyme